jgi:phosphatidate cytidylyltransferase
MIERFLTVLVAVPIIFLCTYLGDWWFFGIVTLLAIVAINEFYNLVKAKGFSPYYTIGNLFTILIVILVTYTLRHPNWEPVSAFLLTAAVITCFCSGVLIRRSANAIANIGTTLLGILYIGWLFSYLVLIRALTPHGIFLIMLMFVLWINDTMAYFVGKTIGRRQLSPYISPKKTVEGSAAGLAGALLTSLAFGALIERSHFGTNYIHYIVLGLLVGGIGQISDLSESLIKRDAGVKDSSKLIPGHGGVLDRMDGFIFAAPVLYYYVYFFLK